MLRFQDVCGDAGPGPQPLQVDWQCQTFCCSLQLRPLIWQDEVQKALQSHKVFHCLKYPPQIERWQVILTEKRGSIISMHSSIRRVQPWHTWAMSTFLRVGKPPFLPGSFSPTQLGITDLSLFRSFCPKSDVDSCATERFWSRGVRFRFSTRRHLESREQSEGERRLSSRPVHLAPKALKAPPKKTVPPTAECLKALEPRGLYSFQWLSQMEHFTSQVPEVQVFVSEI